MLRLNRLVILAFCLSAISQFCLAERAPRELIVKLNRVPRYSLDDQIISSGVRAIDLMITAGLAAARSPFGPLQVVYPDVASVALLTFSPAVDLDSIATVIKSDPDVMWVAFNNLYRSNGSLDEYVPNDSLFSQEWWLEKIDAPAAWEISRGDSGIVIGIIDTGIDYLHPDLLPNLWVNWSDADSDGVDDDQNGFVDDKIGWDFVDAPTLPSSGDHLERDNDPMDEFGHGTYVAGVASSATDNAACVASIGFNCRIMCLRAGNAEGYLEEDDIASAVLYAAANGAAVLNMSFGDVVASPLLREVCQIAFHEGVVLLASAGNANSQSIHYPSGFAEVIAVGASDRLDRRAGFSNYGPSVDVLAPGVDILSTILGGECGEWLLPNGTSYSVPIAAGTAALMLSVNPSLSPADVKQVLRTTADDLRGSGWDDQTTHGRLNAFRAVQQAQSGSVVVARITQPALDQGVYEAFTVLGESWGAAFDHYELSYGFGENPEEYTIVASGTSRHYGDSLGTIVPPSNDTILVVRLESFGTSGQFVSDFRHLYVQHAPPVLDTMIIRRMLDGNTHADLVQVQTNQATTASFILINPAGDSLREDFGYVADNHAGVLTQEAYPGEWSVQVRLENQAGLVALSQPFDFFINSPPFVSALFAQSVTNLRHGYMGPFSTDFDCNGSREMWYLNIGLGGTLTQPLEPHEWNGHEFVPTGNTYGIHIPQATGDADADGLAEMMGRNGTLTRIWEQSGQCGALDSVVFEATNFVGSGFFDIITGDGGRLEIVGRKFFGPDSLSRARYAIYTVVGDNYSLAFVDSLPNQTSGSNDLGPPTVLIGDLDNDSNLDFLYGDYDGDVIFVEYEDGEFNQKWAVRLPQNDATAYLASGDMDNDGVREFVAGCRSNAFGGTESQRKSAHWEYFIFESNGNDQFVKLDSVFILGSSSVSDYPASVTAVDVDGDNLSEILISAFPDYYIVHYESQSGRYLPEWYDFPSASNTSWWGDFNQNGINEFFISNSEQIVNYEAHAASGERPLPPVGITGEPLGETSIALAWRSVAGADSYRVYAVSESQVYDLVASTVDTRIVLTGLPTEVRQGFVISNIDYDYTQPESPYSNPVYLTPNLAPASDDSARFIEPHFIEITFSEPMGSSAWRSANYHLQDQRMPGVILSGNGGRSAMLAFEDTLQPGLHVVQLANVRDEQGTQLPDQESVVFVRVLREIDDSPAIAQHRLVGGPASTAVEIRFTQPMNESVLSASNYELDLPRRSVSVSAMNAERSLVEVRLDARYPVGAIGDPVRMRLTNLKSATGVPLDTSAGRASLLLSRPESSLENVYVYPNPYAGVGPNGTKSIMFAALPESATIRIFTIHGTVVRELLHQNSVGGTAWDLKNSDGNDVASGVYLYSIESSGEIARGKFAVLR